MRLKCRDEFVSSRLLERIIPDIKTALMLPKGGAASDSEFFDCDAAAPAPCGTLWRERWKAGACSLRTWTKRRPAMVVMILERVPPGLRGELTRWFLEPKAGVFVGRVSAAVRDRLWNKACMHAREGGCLMIYKSDNEQGFRVLSWGQTARAIEDFEGLFLVRVP